MHPEGSTLSISLLPAPEAAPITVSAPTRTAPDEWLPATEYLELCRLADRAELWATIAPGLGHHLANALMSLSLPGDHPVMRGSAQTRIERAHHVLNGMCEQDAAALPVPLAAVFADVEAWHHLQLALPRCEVRRELDGLPFVASDARLHHALLAIVTMSKEAGADRITLRGRSTDQGAAIEIEAEPPVAGGFLSATPAARRMAVVEHLLGVLGGSVRMELRTSSRRWILLLPRLCGADC